MNSIIILRCKLFLLSLCICHGWWLWTLECISSNGLFLNCLNISLNAIFIAFQWLQVWHWDCVHWGKHSNLLSDSDHLLLNFFSIYDILLHLSITWHNCFMVNDIYWPKHFYGFSNIVCEWVPLVSCLASLESWATALQYLSDSISQRSIDLVTVCTTISTKVASTTGTMKSLISTWILWLPKCR